VENVVFQVSDQIAFITVDNIEDRSESKTVVSGIAFAGNRDSVLESDGMMTVVLFRFTETDSISETGYMLRITVRLLI